MSSVLLALSLVFGAPCDEAHPVKSGDQVPCDGVLISGWEAMQALRCLSVALPDCESTVTKLDGEAEVLSASHKREVSALNMHIEGVNRALASMAKCPECERAWWDSPALGFGAGVVTTAAVVLALVLGTK